MTDAAVVLALWVAFAATHMLPSSARLRPRLVAAVGERAFLGLYSLVALAVVVPLFGYYFSHSHMGPHLFGPYLGLSDGVTALRWFMYAGMGVTFTLLFAGLLRPSPAMLLPGKAEVRGPHHITRHPVFMAAGGIGVLHLLVMNAHATDLAFFLGLATFAVLGSWHQDRRKLASANAEFRRFQEDTPFLPFTGSNTLLGLRELPPLSIALGIASAWAIRAFHPQLFGG